MLILVAESKAMSSCRGKVSATDFDHRHPQFESKAGEIMAGLREFDMVDLAYATKLSPQMAARLREMAFSFTDKSTGADALEAFSGVVFKSFSYSTLSTYEKTEACRRVRIISSLYGLLRPEDIIKPYRLDFNMRLSPDGETFAAYWRGDVTDAILRYLSDYDCHSILNLLPADAAKCIDWHPINTVADVCKAEFKEIQSGDKVRTPHAVCLKSLRGKLLRRIITDNISEPEQLLKLSSDDFIAEGKDGDGNIIFHTAL